MNVHKRCKDNVANTCGINPRQMADILADMGMSVSKLSLPGKTKVKNNFLGGASPAGTDAPKSVKMIAVGPGGAPGVDGLTSLQEMVEKQAGTHKSVLQDFRSNLILFFFSKMFSWGIIFSSESCFLYFI